MRVYAGMDPRAPLLDAAPYAQRIEALGYDGLHVAETVHDSLAVALVALQATAGLTVRTSVTLAFVRSPTLTAYAAWDLAKASGGRFQLGLGSQIRQNIEDRFAMPWSEPIGRMRDYVLALRDLFSSFASGGGVHHEGEHYRVTRLQPYFNPGPDAETVPPPIWLGGVNAGACALAGELADGFVTHPTNSNRRYIESVCRPNLAAGAERAGRSLADVELVVGAPVVTGRDAEAVAAERERQRRLFAFLYSTPAYRRTLDLYGWGDLQGALAALTREQRWDDLAAVVTDEVLDTLVPSAVYEDLAKVVLTRTKDLGQGVLLSPPSDPADDEAFVDVVAQLKAS